MKEKLSSWGFAYTCALCQDQKATKASVIVQRRKILDQLSQAFQPPGLRGPDTIKIEGLL